MVEFPREFFNPGDSPQKLLDHKLLNWIIERCTRDITVGSGLTLTSNPYFVAIGLAKFITAIRPVELVEVLDAGGHALSHSIVLTGPAEGEDEAVITVDDTLPLTVIDIFQTRSVIGTRGLALEVEFSQQGNWIFIPVSAAVGSSSSASSTSGDDQDICNIPPPRPSDINGRVQGTIQILGVDADGCWRLYTPSEGCEE